MCSNAEEAVRSRLFNLKDEKYRQFHSSLMPTVDAELIIGVRVPKLRALAAELAGTETAREFMEVLPHRYYEENNLHVLFISMIKDYRQCVEALERFLPYVDNWATCDLLSPKAFKKHPAELPEQIKRYLSSGHTYTVRFGIEMLMQFYLDEYFLPEYPGLVAAVRSEEYYINMMIAWYFATALAKQYDAVLPYIEEHRLDVWIHNKTIQKSLESFRVSEEHKAYLRTLKVPGQGRAVRA